MNTRFTKEESLHDMMMKDPHLPLTIRISKNKIYENTLSLQEGQHLTILGTERYQVLEGFDQEGRRVLIRKETDTQINLVEEMIARTEEDIHCLIEEVTVVVLKKKIGYNSIICESGESFFLDEYLPSEKSVVLLRDKCNTKITVPIEVFLNPLFFSMAKIKGQGKLSDLISSLQRGNVIMFLMKSCKLPSGFIHVENIESIEVVHAVTVSSSTKCLLYQTFPKMLNDGIVGTRTYNLPKHIQLLGNADTSEFLGKLEEVRFLNHYDCYASILYGSFTGENPYWKEDLHLQIKSEKDDSKTTIHLPSERNDRPPYLYECTLKSQEPSFKGLASQKFVFGKKSLKQHQKTKKESSMQFNQENINLEDYENKAREIDKGSLPNSTGNDSAMRSSSLIRTSEIHDARRHCNNSDKVTNLDEDDDDDFDSEKKNDGDDDDGYESIDLHRCQLVDPNPTSKNTQNSRYENFISFAFERERENPIYGMDPIIESEPLIVEETKDHIYESIKLRPIYARNPLPNSV